MTDIDALLRAILDHPDDDTPRLIYADALEDVGESDRAAFVRTQVELARVPEYDPLAVRAAASEAYRRQNAAAMRWLWSLPELPDGLRWSRQPFRRGFPAAVEARDGAAFAAGADVLFAACPIEDLELRVARPADVAPLAGCQWLRRVARLTLRQGLGAQVARRLFESRHLERLTELTVGAPMSTPATTRAVVRSKAFGRLTAFTCHTDGRGGRAVIDELTQLADPPHLTKLDLARNQVSAERVARLAAAPVMSAVEELDLSDNPVRFDGTSALAAARLPRLRALHLTRTLPGEAGVVNLARSELMAELRALYLGGNNLGPLAGSIGEWAPHNLRVLDLTENRLGDAGAIALAEGEHLRGLIHLDLAQNMVEDAGAEALAGSPHLGGLIYLNLFGNVISPPAARRLRDRFGDRVFI